MTWEKPTDKEEEYFMKMDMERLKRKRDELDKKREETTKLKQKDTHWMKCPKCGSDLKEMNYKNVIIDKCPDCLGIWLDQGEIELLVSGEAQVTKGLLKKIMG